MDKSNNTIEYALKYAALGLKVFPCAAKKKIPSHKGWQQEATKDLAKIDELFGQDPEGNIGIATGSGSSLIVIDIDNHNDVDGIGNLREWELHNGKLPETATVITGSGGYHYYYRTDKCIKGATGVLDGVDIRAEGNLIVAPPSIHPNGNPYQWDAGADIDDIGIAEADETVLKLAGWRSETDEVNNAPYELPALITEGQRNGELFRYGCSLRAKKEIKPLDVVNKIKEANQKICHPPLSDKEVDVIINQVLIYKQGTDLADMKMMMPDTGKEIELLKKHTKSGDVIRQCAENVVRVIEQDPKVAGRIKYNTMRYCAEYYGQLFWHKAGDLHGQWSDMDDSNLRSYLSQYYGLEKDSAYNDGFNVILSRNQYNPIVSWLESLPAWDKKPYIENLMPDYLGVEKSEYSTAALKLHMVAAITRLYEAGCKYDYVLVLVGKQGSYKSTFLERLAVHADWFDGNFSVIEGNQAVEHLSGKWILEMAELLAVKKHKDVEAFKAFVTATSDNYRQPYGRRTTDRLRQCVFCATTNDYEFESDLTGNRRYLPVRVAVNEPTKDIMSPNQEGVKKDFERAWSEALWIYRNQHPALVLSKKLDGILKQEQEKYLEENPYQGLIEEYLKNTASRQCVQSLWENALHFDGTPKKNDAKNIIQLVREKIDGWEDVGRKRCGNYGTVKCFERTKAADLEDVPEDEAVPF